MATQSLDILQKKWSRVRKKQETEISRLYPDGYLKLREDPEAWIKLNPQDRLQRVRRLELNLEYKDEAEEIGDSIGELTHLTHFSIHKATSLKCLPNVITRLHYLQVLKIYFCDNLQELPASLGELHSLTHLTLTGCDNLQELPARLGELHSLTHLILRSCVNLRALPTSLGELHSLTYLTLYRCYNLQKLPTSLGYFGSRKDNHFPSFGKLSNLQISILGGSQIPINLDDMPGLLFLDLQQSHIRHFSCLPNIKNLPKLGILSLPQWFRLETLPFDLNDSLIISVDETHTRKTWKELKTEMMWSFSNPLTRCSSQNHFNISPQECLLLNEAPMQLNLNSYESVRLLDLSICEDDAEKLNSIKELSQLTHLYIEEMDCSDYIDLKYLPNTITRLRHLSLKDCDYESFSNCLDMLTNLESLDLYLSDNKLPENIDVSVLVNLRCLTLQYGEMRSLPDSMAKLSNLKTLVLRFCCRLKSLPPDMNLVKLKLDCTFIDPLPTGLRHLEILNLSEDKICGCEYVNTDYLKELVNLETLSITCPHTKFLPVLEGLLNLQELQLKDCFNLRKMPNLGKLSKLCTLNISGTRIKTLPACITNLHNLKDLILPKCFKKESLPHNFGKEPVVIIDDIHEEYYKRMGFYDSYYKITSDDDSEITSDIDEVVDEEDAKISHEGHNTMQSTLHQLQNLPGDQTPVLGDSSEFGQEIINDVVSSPQYIFLDKSEVTQFPEGFEVWRTHMPNNENLTLHQTETLSIDTANQVEGHHSQGRNDAICEDSKHALHSLQNQHSKVNNNQQSDDSKVTTQKIDIPLEKIQSQMSKNITIVQAAKNLEVSRSTLKRRLKKRQIKWPRNNKKICKDAKTTKDDVEPSSRKCSSLFNLVNPINPRDQKLAVGINQDAPLPNNVPFECPTTTQGNMNNNQQYQEHSDAVGLSERLCTEPPNESSSTFVVKFTCNGHTGRINFCLTKSIDQLKEEVRNKLEFEEDNFFMEYEDEEQEWVIMNSISDLKHAALLHSKSSSGQNVVRLRISPKIKSCYSTSMTTPMSQVIRSNIQSDNIHLRVGIGSSSTRLKSTAPYAPAINKMLTLDSFLYREYLPAIMDPYLEGWLNVKADGNCGFRVVADAFHGGEDNWAHARRSMYNALGFDTIYDRLYGGQQEVREAMNRILWDNSVQNAPSEHWMTSIQDLFVIATFYNCVVIYFSFGATPAFRTILPLRALSGIQRPYGELAIAHCGTHPHYIRVFLLKDAPLPPIANHWHKIRDPSVEGWVEYYATRFRTV
ncbi:unnamed protein product [Amaranthus hypochondriacus]